MDDDIDEFDVFDELNAETRVEPMKNAVPITVRELIDAQKTDQFSRVILTNQPRGDNRLLET